MGHQAHAEGDKISALIIIIIAGLIALAHGACTNAQTTALVNQMQATDAWSFYQAKTVRQTTLKTALDQHEIQGSTSGSEKVEGWKTTIARYESDPEKKEGKKELMERAKELEKECEHNLHAFHKLEIAIAIFEIAIILVTASVITNINKLKWGGVLVAFIGTWFFVIGKWFPMGFGGGH